jgi:dipeptidyl-peptidase-4
MRPGLIVLVVALVVPLYAETPKPNFRLANKYSKKNLEPLTYSTSVTPGWIGKTDTFWYSYRSSAGSSYWLVDPAKRSRVPLFDKEKLSARLAEVSRKPVDASTLSLTRGSVSSDGGRFSFVFSEGMYEYDLKAEKLTYKGKAPAPGPGGTGFGKRRSSDDEAEDEPQETTKGKGKGRATSPDRKTTVFVKDHNLYISEPGKDPVPLTKDGIEDHAYSIPSTGFGTGGGTGRTTVPLPEGFELPSPWAKDSDRFYAYRQDTRGVKELYVINSLASPRPTLEKYKYAMPGEDAIRRSELMIGSRASKVLTTIAPKWRDETYHNVTWDKAPGELRFIRLDRLQRNLELCAVDVGTAKARVLIAEGFDNAPIEYQTPRYLNDSAEMIWWSERSGWGHFYLYDRNGKLKNAITSGSWRASRIVAVDEKERVLYFQGNGRNENENVYYDHLYSVNLDGTGLKQLDDGRANHRPSLSPSRKFLVDNLTGVDVHPESVVRNDKGELVMTLEKADLSALKAYGWKPAETFVVKAGDGVTDLYGNLWKPFDFDPKKKYPIIAHVYPGPQQEGVTHSFTTQAQGSPTPLVWNSNMQLAQLGFIVIQVGHRGGAPTRSKAYHAYGYLNLRDYGLVDKKTAIEQLAARFEWIDLNRVGIYGHSGGGFMSAAAMLQKPYNEFFKAAVASAGNHDNNIYNNYWAERYHGLKEIPAKVETKDATKGPMTPAAPPVKSPPPEPPPAKTKFEIRVPTNAELAANLKGRLMLVHGEADNNVHPANTMRLVDALIKANKRFDLLILPATRHAFGEYNPYFTRRMWEFFAEHLMAEKMRGADLLDAGE